LYGETEGTIVTAFDSDLLAKYCLLEQECDVMQTLRDAVLKNYDSISGQIAKMRPRGEDMKEFNKLMEQANALLARYQGLDARLDGKRKLLHALAQSLYLTPRSRAGVAPAEKGPKEPDDPMANLLDGD
jgi:phage terminase small subunit